VSSAALFTLSWMKSRLYNFDCGTFPAFNESSQHFVCRPGVAVR
jgi:hypothetical protein